MGMTDGVRCIQQANAVLGEGPVWDWRTGGLFWIDIRRQQIFRHNLNSGQQTGQWAVDERIGCVALTGDTNKLLVAAGLTVSILDLVADTQVVIANLSQGREFQRFNDGAVDAAGRLWVGTMLDDFYEPTEFTGGALHRIDPDGTVESFGEYLLPNGIGWTKDNSTMFLNDTVAGATFALDFDLSTGSVGEARAIFQPDAADGGPDGLTVDANDNIWCAMWDGGRVIKLARDGAELHRIEMPVRRPSAVAFGGEQMDQLLVTSATVGFSSKDFAQSPQAGGLFCVSVDATGKPENVFGQAVMGLTE